MSVFEERYSKKSSQGASAAAFKKEIWVARSFQTKEQMMQRLKEKAAFRNPDEFYFNMSKTKTSGGVHRLESGENKYSKEERMFMQTQDIGYSLQLLQSEKKVNYLEFEIEVERTLHIGF